MVFDSPYYPPRAGWLSRRSASWNSLLRRVRPVFRFAASLCVPGLVFWLRGQKRKGGLLAGSWLIAMAVYWACLGTLAATGAWMLLLMIHAVCVTETLAGLFPASARRQRLMLASAAAFLLVTASYTAFWLQVSSQLVTVVHLYGQAVLVNPRFASEELRAGQWVVYRTKRGIVLAQRILAISGDTVRFLPDRFEVNGVPFPRIAKEMPGEGKLTVPKGSFFIWPIGVRWSYASYNTSARFMALSMVSSDRIIGVAYERWFWRAQKHPPMSLAQDAQP